jgi:eukaryotic-like serine/threonine-protein kinase
MGSMAYMAPEQIIGGDVSERTDIYAAGHILFELLAGRRVYSHLDVGEIARLKIRGSDPTLSGPPMRGALGAAIARSTALDPSRRYQTGWDFIAHLHELRRMSTADLATNEFTALS